MNSPTEAIETTLKMNSYKWNARMVGVLIILGYLTYGIPQGTHILPLTTAADPLAAISGNPMQLTIGALIMAINSAAVVGISLFVYPVIKQYNETIAVGYVVTRIFESIVMVGGIISLLLLIPLSQEYMQASGAAATSLHAVGTLVVQGDFFAYRIAMIGLSIGSLPFCYLLYQTKLVPNFISILGLVGYPALLVLMVVEIISAGTGPILYLLYIPGAMFEIGLALWLIARGFNSAAVISRDSAPKVTGVSK
ncbi:DUF4386 domain-containing protein [Saliphagus sp. GCM10025308]